jgi:hypothetical protein
MSAYGVSSDSAIPKADPIARVASNPIRVWGFRASLLVLSVAVLLAYRYWRESQLGNESFATGYVLSAICLALFSLGLRKRVYGVSLGPVALWQQAHHFLGSLCLIAYVLHAGFLTNGWLESLLAILFWCILTSGFVSWYVNKRSPRLLQAAGKAILSSEIPSAKRELLDQAYHIALRAAGNTRWSAVADLYRSRLEPFFQKPRSIWYRISPNGRRRRALLAELDASARYLDAVGLKLQQEMRRCIERRDDLDFQLAIQQRIRFWAAFHSCLMGAFFVVAIFHILIAHFFSSHW